MLIHFGGTVPVFGICVFVLGLVTAAVRSDRSAFRFGGVTMAIVMLVARTEPAWHIAFHRFAEVSIGIVMALIFAMIWPESKEASSVEKDAAGKSVRR